MMNYNDMVGKALIETEESTLKRILAEYLDREPTEEDAKKFRKIKMSDDISPNYDVLYENTLLGSVIFTYEGIKFEANDT